MRRETEKSFAQVTMGLLIGWTSICFFIGMVALFFARPILDYELIFTMLLTGILGGILAILAYLCWRIGEQ